MCHDAAALYRRQAAIKTLLLLLITMIRITRELIMITIMIITITVEQYDK